MITCKSLRSIQYLIFTLHGFNTIVSLINLTGLEIKICNSNLVCGLLLFEIGMLAFMQISYFQSMKAGCIEVAPSLYFWLMGQILAVYIGIGTIICYFLKKFCKDPNEEENTETEDEQKPNDLKDDENIITGVVVEENQNRNTVYA